VSPKTALTPVGANGTPAVTTAALGTRRRAGADLVARDDGERVLVPLTRPGTTQVVPLVVQVLPSGELVTVWSRTGRPFPPGRVKDTVAVVSPRTPLTPVGANGHPGRHHGRAGRGRRSGADLVAGHHGEGVARAVEQPVTVQLVAAVVQVRPPGELVTVWSMTGRPCRSAT
jgi:hypothetical protein